MGGSKKETDNWWREVEHTVHANAGKRSLTVLRAFCDAVTIGD
jgi:hypothetical protein